MNTPAPQEANSTVPEGSIETNDLNTFVHVLTDWHTNKVALVKHMSALPEGTEVILEEGGDAIKMEGDMLKGYQLGIKIALAELGTLPFVAVMEDEVAANDSAAG